MYQVGNASCVSGPGFKAISCCTNELGHLYLPVKAEMLELNVIPSHEKYYEAIVEKKQQNKGYYNKVSGSYHHWLLGNTTETRSKPHQI